MRIAHLCMALAAVFAVSLFGPALAQPAAAGSQAPPAAGAAVGGLLPIGDSASGAYILGRDDVIEVTLLGRTDFGGRVRVQADGSIQLPLIGKLQAAEHTTAELSDLVRKGLQSGGYFADPIVSVEVVSFASRYVTVLGACGIPGLVPMNRSYRLSEIMARSGGVRDGAADYVIVRPENGPEKHYPLRDLATGDQEQDPYVRPGDKIYCPVADVFYIYGQVGAPGAYPLTGDMTVRMAIAKGGGLTESGSDKRIKVVKDGKKVKAGIGDKVAPGDVLFVGERLF